MNTERCPLSASLSGVTASGTPISNDSHVRVEKYYDAEGEKDGEDIICTDDLKTTTKWNHHKKKCKKCIKKIIFPIQFFSELLRLLLCRSINPCDPACTAEPINARPTELFIRRMIDIKTNE